MFFLSLCVFDFQYYLELLSVSSAHNYYVCFCVSFTGFYKCIIIIRIYRYIKTYSLHFFCVLLEYTYCACLIHFYNIYILQNIQTLKQPAIINTYSRYFRFLLVSLNASRLLNYLLGVNVFCCLFFRFFLKKILILNIYIFFNPSVL